MPLRKSAKGLPAAECVRQVLLFLVDGTSRHLTHFDSLKRDEWYAATIEQTPDDLVSSHAVKRFFRSITFGRIVLKITQAVLDQLRFDKLWLLCSSPPKLAQLAE